MSKDPHKLCWQEPAITQINIFTSATPNRGERCGGRVWLMESLTRHCMLYLWEVCVWFGFIVIWIIVISLLKALLLYSTHHSLSIPLFFSSLPSHCCQWKMEAVRAVEMLQWQCLPLRYDTTTNTIKIRKESSQQYRPHLLPNSRALWRQYGMEAYSKYMIPCFSAIFIVISVYAFQFAF